MYSMCFISPCVVRSYHAKRIFFPGKLVLQAKKGKNGCHIVSALVAIILYADCSQVPPLVVQEFGTKQLASRSLVSTRPPRPS